ncbi:LysR substrate-binding domain-containing protein [Kushneria indalinina]|uniref:LysR family transcriptional regulator n=1 Tax=Kushneria indalinina DSM 14324 TaxID=1122140 RepID=A0A3D9DSE8_9GAMM|nr:LysR substrate-binding domain-containing protein [Kushneria indalinina]REC93690.1 LysR family transcriptional regulator [Kushneria indalinina DSM 14324]
MTIPYRAIAVFHAVARNGSLTAAGVELSITPSAVHQQVHHLESHLGVKLFNRSGRKITLTEVGEQYYADISAEIMHIENSTIKLKGYRDIKTLSIRAAPTFAACWLNGRIDTFLKANDDIEVHIDGNSEPPHFLDERVDIDIRYGSGIWSGLYIEPLLEDDIMPLCAPHVAASASLTPDDLFEFRLTHSIKNMIHWDHWFSLAEIQPPGRWRRILFDRGHMALDFAAGGGGIALEGRRVAQKHIDQGRLVCPVDQPPLIRRHTHWIVCPYQNLRIPKVRRFIDWLRAEIMKVETLGFH